MADRKNIMSNVALGRQKDTTKTEITRPVYMVEKQEAVYKAAELAKNSRQLFKAPAECVMAAFKIAGRSEATLIEARKWIREFMEKEIR